MTFEQFKYVLEVAKTKSINQAAKNLYVSQSALSNSIIKLESELNKQIFIRNNQGVSLTSFGNDFVSYIIPIYDQIMQLNHLLIKNTTSNYSDFSVSSNGFRFVSNICSDMYKLNRLSGIHIHQFDGLGDETIDYVANGQVDLGVFRIWDCYKKFYMQQFKTKKIQFFPLSELNICVLVGEGNPLFNLDNDNINVNYLSNFPMIVHSHLNIGPYSDIFSRLKIPVNNNKFIVNSRSAIYELLKHTDAYYISSDTRCAYNSNITDNLRTLVLNDVNIKSIIGWIKREDYYLSEIAKDFINEINNLFKV